MGKVHVHTERSGPQPSSVPEQVGYKEGLEEGKAKTLQHGFHEGEAQKSWPVTLNKPLQRLHDAFSVAPTRLVSTDQIRSHLSSHTKLIRCLTQIADSP